MASQGALIEGIVSKAPRESFSLADHRGANRFEGSSRERARAASSNAEIAESYMPGFRVSCLHSKSVG
jgi:hypothetical protein